MKPIPVKDRFEAKFDKGENCWIWKNCRSIGGYGQFFFNGRLHAAHRVSYMLYVGEIGDLKVLHKCDNPPCVNPDHLFLGTDADNVRDKVSKNRHTKGITNGASKLDETQVLTIKSITSLTHKQIANYFKIDESNVSYIKSKTWKHLNK